MSANTAKLVAELRPERGGRAAHRLRKLGRIPAIIYGHGKEAVAVSVDSHTFGIHLHQKAHVFDLAIGNVNETVLVKEFQHDPMGRLVQHIDFTRVDLNEKVRVKVPVELRGKPKGEADGGVLQQIIAEVEIECLVTEIPEFIRQSVVDLELDAVLHVKDLVAPGNSKILTDPEQIVALVREVKEEVVEVAAADATAEPELIGRKAADDEAAAEGDAKGGKAPAKAPAKTDKK